MNLTFDKENFISTLTEKLPTENDDEFYDSDSSKVIFVNKILIDGKIYNIFNEDSIDKPNQDDKNDDDEYEYQ